MDEREIGRQGQEGESDEVLVKAFIAGSNAEHAFDRLVIKHKDRIFNLCYRFIGIYEEADDCAQETFLKAYRSLKNFRFDSSFSTWLYRIAVNTCKNRVTSAEYRSKKKMVRLDEPINGGEGDCKLEIKDESLSPVAAVEREEKAKLIQEAIDSLPEDQKKVVILKDIEQLSYEEIARVTGFNLGTVKSRLSRARQALCEKLRRLV